MDTLVTYVALFCNLRFFTWRDMWVPRFREGMKQVQDMATRSVRLLTEFFSITSPAPPLLFSPEPPAVPRSRRETMAQDVASCHRMTDFFTPIVQFVPPDTLAHRHRIAQVTQALRHSSLFSSRSTHMTDFSSVPNAS
jgi:hypothetical protein